MRLWLEKKDIEEKLAQMFELEGMKIVGETEWKLENGEGEPLQPSIVCRVEPCVPGLIVSEVTDMRVELSDMFEQLTKSMTSLHKKVSNGAHQTEAPKTKVKVDKPLHQMTELERAQVMREERLAQIKKDIKEEAEEYSKAKRPSELILPKNR